MRLDDNRLSAAKAKVPSDPVLMTKAGYPKMYKQLGPAKFDTANELMSWAVLAAANSKQCSEVTDIGVSDKSTRKAITWYVDCKNSERFMISEEQAIATRDQYDPSASPEAKARAAKVAVAEPKSARWKSFKEGDAVTACRTLVQSTMTNQRSFDAAWTWDSQKDDDTGLVTLQQDFNAQNGFGATISSRYSCVVNADQGSRIVKLSIREAAGWRKVI
ncbi:hypothetical protein [Sphingopyxis fribergensis]